MKQAAANGLHLVVWRSTDSEGPLSANLLCETKVSHLDVTLHM